jgi:hypothetical protein
MREISWLPEGLLAYRELTLLQEATSLFIYLVS